VVRPSEVGNGRPSEGADNPRKENDGRCSKGRGMKKPTIFNGYCMKNGQGLRCVVQGETRGKGSKGMRVKEGKVNVELAETEAMRKAVWRTTCEEKKVNRQKT